MAGINRELLKTGTELVARCPETGRDLLVLKIHSDNAAPIVEKMMESGWWEIRSWLPKPLTKA